MLALFVAGCKFKHHHSVMSFCGGSSFYPSLSPSPFYSFQRRIVLRCVVIYCAKVRGGLFIVIKRKEIISRTLIAFDELN
jgi:hypothetical protein